ncbi:O-antigen ligase family protein [Psychrobacter sp. 72-O-c]|uniref:O-antigen ligase family protein n=1 Tax=Psychrobacter sp. 72-O-c TaxID=2774125 RepID=UPI001918E21E|nr:O-antigen ligase family protein [Psychrobacter sp. 72-O-c]
MYNKNPLSKQHKLQTFIKSVRLLFNKELSIGLYFLLFILGMNTGSGHDSYNEFRVFQVTLLLVIGVSTWCYRRLFITKLELLFFAFIAFGSFFWQQPIFVLNDVLLVYLLYKSFYLLNYQPLLSKLIVLSSLLIFLLLPVALWNYIDTGKYSPIWYPLPWNMRVYDSYFLIISVFAVWFYLTEKQYRFLYLLFLFLAFLAVLLDGGRSVTLAYTVFIAIISLFHRRARWRLVLMYAMSWLTYIIVTYTANTSVTSLRIARDTRSDRYDLWINAFQCWSQHPLFGCGFYQLDKYPNIAAHPHNLFIQVLTETGLIGFGFLAFIIFKVAKNINWDLKQNYFVIAALLAISIDMSLSGVHIYPVTQIALLWLFVFLLKNPEFSHAHHFNKVVQQKKAIDNILPLIIYLSLTIWFIYLFTNTSSFLPGTPLTPPRFWVYGYQLW